MHYGDNRPKYIRWAIFTLLVVGACVLQNASGSLLEIFGARVFLLIPVCVSVAMFEREVPSAIIGAFAGVMWDISSGADGYNALVIMLLCAGVSLLISHLMRNNIVTALVLGAGATFVYEFIYIIRIAFAGNPIYSIFTFYLPSFVLTVAFMPVCYYIIKTVYRSFKVTE
ncbi:MAG: rod shape-determining protein MreD [Clostridia bacterium]|nr:rod shape-determining protein MreD [Clostridia bacterium]